MSFFKALFGRSAQPTATLPTDAMRKVIRAHAAFADASMLMVQADEHHKDPAKQKIIALFHYGAIDAYSQMAGLDANATYDLLFAYLSNVSFCADPQAMAAFVCDASADPKYVDAIRLGGQTATDFNRGNAVAAGRLHRYLFEMND